jgi:hypothetical protein
MDEKNDALYEPLEVKCHERIACREQICGDPDGGI